MKPKVLIVDDNAAMRRLVRSIVRELSDTILECSDGAEAIRSYREHRPDWVLMDIEMPGKNGLFATREICAAFPEARVVIVTRHRDAAMRQAAMDAGARAYVLKENLNELWHVLTEPDTSDVRVSSETPFPEKES